MHIDFETLEPTAAYAMLTQTIVPRPVAWVLSRNEDDSLNLAPYSYFNAISANPPMIMLSIGKHADGREKDTRRNIEARSECVVHIAHTDQAEIMNATAATLDAGVPEIDEVSKTFNPEQLRLTSMPGSSLPRLAECRVAFACRHVQTHEVGPQGVVFASVSDVWLDDSIVDEDAKGRVRVSAAALDPIARLGGGEYVAPGRIISVERPK